MLSSGAFFFISNIFILRRYNNNIQGEWRAENRGGGPVQSAAVAGAGGFSKNEYPKSLAKTYEVGYFMRQQHKKGIPVHQIMPTDKYLNWLVTFLFVYGGFLFIQQFYRYK